MMRCGTGNHVQRSSHFSAGHRVDRINVAKHVEAMRFVDGSSDPLKLFGCEGDLRHGDLRSDRYQIDDRASMAVADNLRCEESIHRIAPGLRLNAVASSSWHPRCGQGGQDADPELQCS